LSGRTNAIDFAELAHQRTQTNQLMLVLERKNRLASWLLVGLLSVLVGIATGIGVVVLRPAPAKEKPAQASAPTAAPLAPRPVSSAAPSVAPEAKPAAPEPLVTDVAAAPRAIAASAPPTFARGALRFPRASAAPTTRDAGVELSESNAPRASTSAARPVEPGFLTLDTSPWSVVSVGGRVLGSTPLVRVALPPGDVVLSLSNPDTGARASYAVRIESGKAVSRRIGLE
jgi:serine/threonine-protein kinase